ncbi:hypothetical protein BD410DRAFT_841468 [Rickenella mellea]|uniref:Uncharacterized protein n=1 Tax=Rickenella mellea TaxID=50990 RepID=A0A4Y7PXG3_9AGAM|nr:hypothetical protein BD410DRAFT_841468 [Rickenella mellea]
MLGKLLGIASLRDRVMMVTGLGSNRNRISPINRRVHPLYHTTATTATLYGNDTPFNLLKVTAAVAHLKFTNRCRNEKRNAKRLADALGRVLEREKSAPLVKVDELVAFANAKFCMLVEKTLSDFVTREDAQLLLKTRRNVVHHLCRMDITHRLRSPSQTTSN